jgi:type III secretory pathway component EscS
MLEGLVQDVIADGMRVLFLVAAPLTALVALAALLVSVLQTTMALRDSVVPYVVRLSVCVAAAVFGAASARDTLVALFSRALGGQ